MTELGRQSVRFTPARAGKSQYRDSPGDTKTVHPRSRGEILVPSLSLIPLLGSPPLARGNLGFNRRFNWMEVVHPRSRGEILSRNEFNELGTWFTPARAGKSAVGV